MFTSNPWAVYASFCTAALLVYYAFIGWKYFPDELQHLFKAKPTQRTRLPPKVNDARRDEPDDLVLEDLGSALTEELSSASQQTEDLLFEEQALYNHLSAEIEEAYLKDYTKQDLIQMLQMILKDYPTLKESPFQLAIDEYIEQECAKYGSLHLDQRDLTQIWLMV